MSKLKIGQTAFLKVTQEPIFLLDIQDGNPTQRFPGLSGKVAVVRRPTVGENGVRHEVEFFTVEEVETLEESQNRNVSEMEEMKARFKNNAKDPDQHPSAQSKLEFSN